MRCVSQCSRSTSPPQSGASPRFQPLSAAAAGISPAPNGCPRFEIAAVGWSIVCDLPRLGHRVCRSAGTIATGRATSHSPMLAHAPRSAGVRAPLAEQMSAGSPFIRDTSVVPIPASLRDRDEINEVARHSSTCAELTRCVRAQEFGAASRFAVTREGAELDVEAVGPFVVVDAGPVEEAAQVDTVCDRVFDDGQ